MNDLNLHYRQLLGLGKDWNVENVGLDLVANRVVIELSHRRGRLVCPECEMECSRADTAPKRTWRHLDTMHFGTEICAAVPRCRCEKCGVKTIAVLWAGKERRSALITAAVTGQIKMEK